jgi:glutathione S-transferase
VPVFPGGTDEDFRKLSPLGKIPAFRDGDKGFFRFLASSRCTSRRSIRARRSIRRTRTSTRAALWFEEYADSAMTNVIGPKIFFERCVNAKLLQQAGEREDVAKAIKEEVPPDLRVPREPADGRVARRQPALRRRHRRLLAVREPLPRGVSIDTAKFPKLARYVARVHERPSFRELHRRRQGPGRRRLIAWRPWRRERRSDPLAVQALALQREGALGARLEGDPTRAPLAPAGAAHAVILWLTGQKSVPVLSSTARSSTIRRASSPSSSGAFPQPALYPADARRAARALELEELFDEEIGVHLGGSSSTPSCRTAPSRPT